MIGSSVRRVATIVITLGFIGAANTASAQSGNDLGSLWRGGSAPAKSVDSAAAKRVADSLKAVAAKRTADSVAKVRADSVAKLRADSVAKVRADSVAKARVADSLSKVRKADSVAKARLADSVSKARIADSIAKVRVADSVARAAVAPAERTIRDQADTIAALRAKLATVAPKVDAKPVEAPKPRVYTPLELLGLRIDTVAAAQKAAAKKADDTEKSLTQKISGLGNFRFTGDVRVRYEQIQQDGGTATRHRERSRIRLGISGNLTDEVSGLIGLASGASEDVQSPNQTQTGFFSRKTVGFDRFFLTYKPKAVNGLSVVAGKFPYAWDRSALTFGNDINPEGIAPSYSRAHKGVFQGFSVVGFALPLLEVSGGKDSYIAGAQLQTRWKPSARTTAKVSASSVRFYAADALALVVNAGTTFKQAAANTNRFRTDSAGKVLGYAHEFAYRDYLASFEFVKSPRLPITAQVNVVKNVKAGSDNDTGLWTDLRAGRLSQPRDVQASWTMFRIERDAVNGAMNEQDLRAATNVLNHKATIAYQWRSNATIGTSLWLGRLLDPTLTGKLVSPDFKTACTTAPFDGCRDPWVKRLQLEVSYKF